MFGADRCQTVWDGFSWFLRFGSVLCKPGLCLELFSSILFLNIFLGAVFIFERTVKNRQEISDSHKEAGPAKDARDENQTQLA